MKSKRLAVLGLGIVAIIAVYLLYPRQQTNGNLDAFAQCLAEKNITVYGAEWCPHCQNEKKAFGDSFRFVPYVECPDNPQKCLAAGINGYPTWIFPGGKKLESEQGLEKLSRESGCALPLNQK
ncbi:MAG: hypothetical protein A3I44_03025 [Candidatus Sungbacteria bacterium RIFCSPLOWO2_02_FULL_51_17]|nr:MAG: hypothetical protein A3I44_03025 [Candidatus Sungbacteria bacterium RIFCSPLOWO2_02_FULL_51_17]